MIACRQNSFSITQNNHFKKVMILLASIGYNIIFIIMCDFCLRDRTPSEGILYFIRVYPVVAPFRPVFYFWLRRACVHFRNVQLAAEQCSTQRRPYQVSNNIVQCSACVVHSRSDRCQQVCHNDPHMRADTCHKYTHAQAHTHAS